MIPQTGKTKLALSDWQTETLRVTAFPSPSATIGQPTWWSDLTGEAPESRTTRPREGVFIDQGNWGGRTLSLGINPTRIDWVFGGIEDDSPSSIFSDSLNVFQELILRWLPMCPAINRLAFGAIVRAPVENREAGYRQIAAYLPHIQLDPVNSSDFLYQINRPRASTSDVNGLTVNRLSKWSVGMFSVIPMNFALQPSRVEVYSVPQTFSCRVEVDINTSQEFPSELPQALLPQILKELIYLGQEIIREGDMP